MAKQTQLEKSLKNLSKVLTEQYESQSAIKREGDRIIIPEYMGFRDAAEAILSHMKKQEEDMMTRCEFDCHPHDGLVALKNAISKYFGTLLGAESTGWFGMKIPGRTITVPVSCNETEVVPVGASEIPGIPVTMQIGPEWDEDSDTGGKLIVIFEHQRKFEPLVKDIEKRIREELRENSIFRGKAINSKFDFMNVESFDETRVVYSRNEKRQIEANILSPIARSKEWEQAGSTLRRGVLLYGEYGTGKTLTALLTGKHCVQNGWTFINVLPGDNITKALRFAKRYQPAVVFFEDIDSDTQGPRDDRVNEILNTIDGLFSKDNKIITVLTTNNIQKVNRGMLRPGRLDSCIKMGILDKDSVIRLIRVVSRKVDGSELIVGTLDEDKIWEAAEGFMPAFVVEAVTKAKAYALSRGQANGNLTITSEDVVDALIELRPQFEMMRSDQEITQPDVDTSLKSIVNGSVSSLIEPLVEDIAKIKKAANIDD